MKPRKDKDSGVKFNQTPSQAGIWTAVKELERQVGLIHQRLDSTPAESPTPPVDTETDELIALERKAYRNESTETLTAAHRANEVRIESLTNSIRELEDQRECFHNRAAAIAALLRERL